MTRTQLYKRYIDVEVYNKKDGTMIPLAIYWTDESGTRRFEIDKVISGPETRASSVGGVGKRYKVLIRGQVRHIYFEKDKWFIESNQP